MFSINKIKSYLKGDTFTSTNTHDEYLILVLSVLIFLCYIFIKLQILMFLWNNYLSKYTNVNKIDNMFHMLAIIIFSHILLVL